MLMMKLKRIGVISFFFNFLVGQKAEDNSTMKDQSIKLVDGLEELFITQANLTNKEES